MYIFQRRAHGLKGHTGYDLTSWIFNQAIKMCNFIILYGNMCRSFYQLISYHINTLDRRQLKMLLTIHECGSKITRNSVFDCHFVASQATNGNQNSVSNDFLSTLIGSIKVFHCRCIRCDEEGVHF